MSITATFTPENKQRLPGLDKKSLSQGFLIVANKVMGSNNSKFINYNM
jgi:hypothetical protein